MPRVAHAETAPRSRPRGGESLRHGSGRRSGEDSRCEFVQHLGTNEGELVRRVCTPYPFHVRRGMRRVWRGTSGDTRRSRVNRSILPIGPN